MQINQIIEVLEAEILGENSQPEREIDAIYASDLMSDVLYYIKPGSLLLTGIVNPHVLDSAEMMDVSIICFINDKRPPNATIELGKKKRIMLIQTRFSMYEACGRLYKSGLSGSGG